jgi:nucleoid-associated protein YgaU
LPSSPPSFTTDQPAPKPPRANRYDSVADEPLPGLSSDKPDRFAHKSNDLRSDPPEVKKRADRADSFGAVSTREEFDRRESSGYASAGGDSLSARHEKSRYENQAGALLPPERVRDNPPYDAHAGRSYSDATASRYDDDFPRASRKPSYDRDKPDRYDAPSYGSLAPRRDDGKYEVQPNDSYWTISEKVYGSGGYFRALAEQNRGKVGNEDRLKPGDLVSTPTVAQLEKSYPDLCPKASRRETIQSRTMAVSTRQSYRGGRNYTVAEGDTLFNIARYELGKASRWAEIYELNRDVLGKDFNYLTPGMQLVLPDNEKADVLTRRSGGSGDLYR